MLDFSTVVGSAARLRGTIESMLQGNLERGDELGTQFMELAEALEDFRARHCEIAATHQRGQLSVLDRLGLVEGARLLHCLHDLIGMRSFVQDRTVVSVDKLLTATDDALQALLRQIEIFVLAVA